MKGARKIGRSNGVISMYTALALSVYSDVYVLFFWYLDGEIKGQKTLLTSLNNDFMSIFRKLNLSVIARDTGSGTDKTIYINIRVTDLGTKRKSAGISVPSKNYSNGQIIGKSEVARNASKRIESIKEKLQDSFDDLVERGILPYPELVIENLSREETNSVGIMTLADKVIEQKELALKSGRASKHLPEKFRVLKGQIQNFISKEYNKKDLFLYMVNHEFVSKFSHYLMSPEIGNSNVTVNKKMSNLGQLFTFAVKNEWMKRNPVEDWRPLPEPLTNNEFLTEEQLFKLYDFELENSTYEIVKDAFIFMCLTGLAISDTKKLTYKQIIEEDGQMHIFYVRKKTQKPIKIPLIDKALDILMKYYNRPFEVSKKKFRIKTVDDPIFQIQADALFNRKLKRMFEFNELHVDFEISSHSARKTFGNLISVKMGLYHASAFLGHSSVKTTEKNYVDNFSNDAAKERSKDMVKHLSKFK